MIKPETQWKQLDALDLDTNYDKYFSAKDHATLIAIYQKRHDVSRSDIDDIMGKLMEVVQ